MDLEKETLKHNGTHTRRILPKEVYELEEEDEKEGRPKGWLSWFQGIYRRDAQEDEPMKHELSIEPPKLSPQSRSSDGTSEKSDSKATTILSNILPTTQKHDSADSSQQVGASPNNTIATTDRPPTKGDSKA